MLELRGIRASYGETVVLRDVDLAVPETGIVALIGPNGAGKTTLLRVASGLLSPDAGQVLLDGEDVTGWPPHRLAALGMCHVPEGRGIYRSLTVEENLRLQARPGTEEEAMQRAAEAFPALLERRAQPAGTLSGGEQQMLALTRAYLRRPRLILLDEVSMGLAPRIVDEIFAFLSRLAAEGTALLLVEQYVTRALAMADFVFLLNRGHVRFAGEPSEVADEDVFARYLGTTV
jgi:branched-chain amino acid transport system ATP-binding protein